MEWDRLGALRGFEAVDHDRVRWWLTLDGVYLYVSSLPLFSIFLLVFKWSLALARALLELAHCRDSRSCALPVKPSRTVHPSYQLFCASVQ